MEEGEGGEIASEGMKKKKRRGWCEMKERTVKESGRGREGVREEEEEEEGLVVVEEDVVVGICEGEGEKEGCE